MFPKNLHLSILFILGCGFLFFFIALAQNYRELVTISDRIQEDITFQNNQWNTTAYNADPLLPGTSPIYVLASDGFVIERWKPIAGYLDASDFKHLLAFNEIQTIQTNSQQDWRVFSLPIEKDGVTHGVVTVSSYHPIPETLKVFDTQLVEVAHTILKHTQINNNNIQVQDLDQRTIPHYVSFQVVNNLNTIVLKGNNNNSIDRLPNFIDPSYVASELDSFPLKIIRDQRTHHFFVTITQPLTDEGGTTKGVIIIGKNLQPLLSSFVTYMGLSMTTLVLFYLFQKTIQVFNQNQSAHKKLITFDEKNSQILIDSNSISIAYASNQYYLCLATIKHPTKRWEADELLDKMGAEADKYSWRKIYDAMNQVNKKVRPVLGKKLIVLEEKTYRLNPELL